jgi:hypothetical protein
MLRLGIFGQFQSDAVVFKDDEFLGSVICLLEDLSQFSMGRYSKYPFRAYVRLHENKVGRLSEDPWKAGLALSAYGKGLSSGKSTTTGSIWCEYVI